LKVQQEPLSWTFIEPSSYSQLALAFPQHRYCQSPQSVLFCWWLCPWVCRRCGWWSFRRSPKSSSGLQAVFRGPLFGRLRMHSLRRVCPETCLWCHSLSNHKLTRFYVIASGVKAHTFSHKSYPVLGVGVSSVGQIHENGRILAASAHCVKQSEALPEQLVSRKGSELKSVGFGEILCKFLEELGSALNISAAIGPLASSVASLGEVDDSVDLGNCLID